jgi:drug/metabolite transporter (DMT)-like permease
MKAWLPGLAWCATFVLLDAVQAVYLGGTLQRMDGFLMGLLVFGPSALVVGLWSWRRDPGQLAVALANRRALIGLNLATAGGWVTYFAAVQLVEPAVAFTLFTGIIPLTAIVIGRFGVVEAKALRSPLERIGNLVLAAGLLLLTAITVFGWSGFVRGGPLIALAGSALATLAGIFMTAMILIGQRLDRKGVGPGLLYAARFPLYLLVALAAWGLGFDTKAPMPPVDIALAVAIGFAVLAFPVYAVQKAISLSSSLAVGTATALTPFVVFLFQAIEGRVEHSNATLAGRAVCFTGAVIASIGGARMAVEKRRLA